MYCTCIVHYISDAVDLATRIQASRTLGYALMNTDCTELFRTGTVFCAILSVVNFIELADELLQEIKTVVTGVFSAWAPAL